MSVCLSLPPPACFSQIRSSQLRRRHSVHPACLPARPEWRWRLWWLQWDLASSSSSSFRSNSYFSNEEWMAARPRPTEEEMCVTLSSSARSRPPRPYAQRLSDNMTSLPEIPKWTFICMPEGCWYDTSGRRGPQQCHVTRSALCNMAGGEGDQLLFRAHSPPPPRRHSSPPSPPPPVLHAAAL